MAMAKYATSIAAMTYVRNAGAKNPTIPPAASSPDATNTGQIHPPTLNLRALKLMLPLPEISMTASISPATAKTTQRILQSIEAALATEEYPAVCPTRSSSTPAAVRTE